MKPDDAVKVSRVSTQTQYGVGAALSFEIGKGAPVLVRISRGDLVGFPPYQRIMRDESPTVIKAEGEKLLRAVAAAVADAKAAHKVANALRAAGTKGTRMGKVNVRLSLDAGRFGVAWDAEGATVRTVADGCGAGSIEFRCNAAYLDDAIDGVKSTVTLGFADKFSPVNVDTDGRYGRRALVMPVMS